jgi:hypothetical protein
MKTENPSACVTVNWKVCTPGIALYCFYFRVECIGCPKNPINQSRTRLINHALPPPLHTRQYDCPPVFTPNPQHTRLLNVRDRFTLFLRSLCYRPSDLQEERGNCDRPLCQQKWGARCRRGNQQISEGGSARLTILCA